jgi:hypothetical protein
MGRSPSGGKDSDNADGAAAVTRAIPSILRRQMSWFEWNVRLADLRQDFAHKFKELIEETPALNWLLLTKRIENYRKHAPVGWQERAPANVCALLALAPRARARLARFRIGLC